MDILTRRDGISFPPDTADEDIGKACQEESISIKKVSRRIMLSAWQPSRS